MFYQGETIKDKNLSTIIIVLINKAVMGLSFKVGKLKVVVMDLRKVLVLVMTTTLVHLMVPVVR